MLKILTVGVFDYFHLGHLRLFKQCKEYADYLIVAVQDDKYIKKFKPEANTLYSLEERMEIIRALRIVDEVVVYDEIANTDRLKKIDFDVFAIGEDQTHAGFKRAEEWCCNNGKKVIRLKRTPGISSSNIKKGLNTNE